MMSVGEIKDRGNGKYREEQRKQGGREETNFEGRERKRWRGRKVIYRLMEGGNNGRDEKQKE